MDGRIERCDRELERLAHEVNQPYGLGEFQGILLGIADWNRERRLIMQEFTSGAKSTVIKPRYDLIPLEALTYIAERFGYGASRHGEWNWQKGAADAEFFRDRKNHAVEHLMNYVNGSAGSEPSVKDQLKAAICNLAMLAWLEERQPTTGETS